MKKTLLLLCWLFIPAFTLLAQQNNSAIRETQRKTHPMVDTRVDNMGYYWKRVAKMGLAPVAPFTKAAPALYKGSIIEAKSVVTDDSPDVPVTEQNSTQSENSIFINPNDNTNVLNSNNSTSNPANGVYGSNDFYSFDSGLTWDGELEGAGGGNSGDPTTAINLDGRYFVGYIHSAGGQGVSYSDDEGQTWTPVLVQASPGGFNSLLDKNHMWIDNSPTSQYEGNLYNAWTNFGGSNDKEIEIARTTNDGVSWESSQNISSAINAGSHNQGVNIQTGPNGEVYVVWTVYDGWPQDENALGFARSTDGGATYEPATRIIENIRGIRNVGVGKNLRVNSFPAMAVDISNGTYNGNIYVVWANTGVPGVNTGSDKDVYLIRSEDQGDTWSTPIRVNQDPTGQGKEHFFPWITVDPESGVVSVIYYDDRNISSTQCEVWVSNSYDGGATWEDFRVSDVAFTPTPIAGLADGYMGDYIGIAARGGMVYPIWMDNRSGSVMTYTSPFATNTLPKPLNLEATLNQANGMVDLTWEFDETQTGFQNYVVYRNNIQISTPTNKAFSETLPAYGKYTYKVTAMFEAGESFGPSANLQWGDAHVAWDPASINAELEPNNMATQFIQFNNTGQLPLEITLSATTQTGSDKAPKSYCDASGGGDEYISNVEVGSIVNASGENGYSDYTAMSTDMNAGESYEITVQNGNGYSGDRLGIWIDWNQDETFGDEESVTVNGSPGNGPYTATITPPDDAISGTTRMRIRLVYNNAPSPCGTTNYGEVEDYSINVISWLAIAPKQLTIAPGTSGQTAVTFNSNNLTLGTYNATMNLASNDPNNITAAIPIQLVVSNDVALGVSVIATPQQVCAGSTTQLQAQAYGGTGTFTYSWTSTPAGFTSTEAAPEVTPTQNTEYTVVINDGENSVNGSVAVTVSEAPQAIAGTGGTICQNETFTLSEATASDYASILWSTSGNGTFNDAASVNPIYTPGSQDIQLGSATLTLTAASNGGCDDATDDVIINVTAIPAFTAKPQGSANVCKGTTTSEYTATAISGATSYTWQLLPAAAGTISNTNNTATVTWNSDFTGDATVAVKAANNCGEGEFSPLKEVTVHTLPSIDLGDDQIMCDYNTLMLDATTVNAASYLWAPNGETTPTITITSAIQPVNTTVEYAVTVTDANGCIGTDAVEVLVDPCVGIEENPNHFIYEVYPNPATDGHFSMTITSGTNRDVHYTITNTEGKTVATGLFNVATGKSNYPVNLSKQSSGIYFIHMDIDDQQFTQKLIIK